MNNRRQLARFDRSEKFMERSLYISGKSRAILLNYGAINIFICKLFLIILGYIKIVHQMYYMDIIIIA